MPFVPAPRVGQFQLIYEEDGQRVENVINVLNSVDWTPAGLQVIAALFVSWWHDHLQELTTSAASLVLIAARDLTTEDGIAIEWTTGLPQAGLGGNHPLPMNVTLAVKMSTGLAGRSNRGRSYFVGLDTAFVDGSTVAIGFQEDLIAAWNSLRASLTAADCTLVVVSRVHDGAPRVTAAVNGVLAFSADRTTDSQRRRLPGRGS